MAPENESTSSSADAAADDFARDMVAQVNAGKPFDAAASQAEEGPDIRTWGMNPDEAARATTLAVQRGEVKNLPAWLKVYNDAAKKNPYTNPEHPDHAAAVAETTIAFDVGVESHLAKDTSDPYHSFTIPGGDENFRHALVGAARADGLSVDTLTRLMAGYQGVSDRLTKAALKSVWGADYPAKAARVEAWLDARPATKRLALADDDSDAGQIAYAIDALMKYEGDVDVQLRELMAPGTAYWRTEDPGHDAAVLKVTELHRRRY